MAIPLEFPCRCQGNNPRCWWCGGLGIVQPESEHGAAGVLVSGHMDEGVAQTLSEWAYRLDTAKNAAAEGTRRKLIQEEIASKIEEEQNAAAKIIKERDSGREGINKVLPNCTHQQMDGMLALHAHKYSGMFTCTHCNYPQNRDPKLACAMCGSLGSLTGPNK